MTCDYAKLIQQHFSCFIRENFHMGQHETDFDSTNIVHRSLQLLEKDGITPAKQRTPNKFALFVKEQYRAEKAENPEMVHADIMKSLGQKFSALST